MVIAITPTDPITQRPTIIGSPKRSPTSIPSSPPIASRGINSSPYQKGRSTSIRVPADGYADPPNPRAIVLSGSDVRIASSSTASQPPGSKGATSNPMIAQQSVVQSSQPTSTLRKGDAMYVFPWCLGALVV